MNSKNGRFILLGCIIGFLVFALPLTNQPLHGDETFFKFFAAKKFGDNFTDFFLGEGQPPIKFYMHTHLHMSILKIFALFGNSNWTVRLPGVFIGILSIILFYKTGNLIIKNKNYTYLGLVLLAFNPYFIQSALLVDMDNTIVAFALLLFSYVWLSNNESKIFKSATYNVKLLLSTIVLLWSKFIAAIVIMPALVIYSILKDRKNFVLVIVFLCLSLGLFYVSWALYISLHNGEYFGILKNVFKAASVEPTASSSLATLGIDMTKKIVAYTSWLNPIVALLFVYLLLKNKLLYSEKSFLLVLVILITLGVNFIVASLPGGFPRYWAPVTPLLILLSVFMLEKFQLPKFEKKEFIVAGIIGILFFFSGSPFLSLWKIRYWSVGLGGLNFFDLLPFIIFPALLVFVIAGLGKKRTFNYAIAIIISVSIAINVQNLMQKEASNYNYGETGMVEVIDLIKSSGFEPKEVLIREDIAYYSFDNKELGKYKHVILWTEPHLKEDKDIEELFKKEDIKLVVWRDMDYFSFSHIIDNTNIRQALKNYNYKRIGNFQIWQL